MIYLSYNEPYFKWFKAKIKRHFEKIKHVVFQDYEQV
jgi:hypothetical protein